MIHFRGRCGAFGRVIFSGGGGELLGLQVVSGELAIIELTNLSFAPKAMIYRASSFISGLRRGRFIRPSSSRRVRCLLSSMASSA